MASLDSSEAFFVIRVPHRTPTGRDSRDSLPTPLIRALVSSPMR